MGKYSTTSFRHRTYLCICQYHMKGAQLSLDTSWAFCSAHPWGHLWEWSWEMPLVLLDFFMYLTAIFAFMMDLEFTIGLLAALEYIYVPVTYNIWVNVKDSTDMKIYVSRNLTNKNNIQKMRIYPQYLWNADNIHEMRIYPQNVDNIYGTWRSTKCG